MVPVLVDYGSGNSYGSGCSYGFGRVCTKFWEIYIILMGRSVMVSEMTTLWFIMATRYTFTEASYGSGRNYINRSMYGSGSSYGSGFTVTAW